MTEIILALIILALLVERYLTNQSLRDERKDWTKAIMAKDLRDLTANEQIEKQPAPSDSPRDEFIPLNADDDTLFDKHIQAELDAAKVEHEQGELTP